MKLRPDAPARALAFVRGSDRPTLVGPLAVALDCSLADAERVLLDLEERGFIRRVTAAERDRFDIRDGYLPVALA